MLEDDSGAASDPFVGLRALYLQNSAMKATALVLFLSRCAADLDRQSSIAETYRQPSPSMKQPALASLETSGDLSDAIRLAHNFVGTGASYGFSEITDQARLIEQRLLQVKTETNLDDLLCVLGDACALQETIRRKISAT
jgi:HPt (histidine-containing phosphotransfer) domain-containing protein